MNRPTPPALAFVARRAKNGPITRPQTIATLRRIIRTLRAKNTQLAEKLLIDLGMNLTA